MTPARAWLTPATDPEAPPDDSLPVVPIDAALLAALAAGDTLRVRDARARKRVFVVNTVIGHSAIVHTERTVYLQTGAKVTQVGKNKVSGKVGTLPDVAMPIVLHQGDALILTRDTEPGRHARHDDEGCVIEPARIGCTLDAVFESAIPGDAIWFDDGTIGGVIVANRDEEIDIRITHAGPNGGKLRPEKGINLPDTEMAIPALTRKDLEDLSAIAPHVDLIGLSFVRTSADVVQLTEALADRASDHLGIVLKIETRQGFRNLPHILLAGLRHPPLGIMVARGDLAVEVGFERLAEVQEQILWLCEAAHVPVIWATQVLEDLAKNGTPSRAEVTDAAMSGRAECVMLNKGPFIAETTRFLSGVLQRMEAHQSKKRSLLRRLSVSESM